MESPGAYPDSPGMDDMDVIYHCKGCGEILEEGKAFELAGNRWHIDCFRCNTCGTLLDSDANLLLLGDGSLICNNCTYSCSACNNKIEDLAILTGDQAFCASCFRCRNCKRKIENLRYARTSQGIFCMSCHESLMARRRKKSKANRQQAESKAPIVLDKSLPALPPSAVASSNFSPDLETPPEIDTPDEFSPRPRAATSGVPGNIRREASPASAGSNEPQTLPASTYREKRRSAMPMSTNFDDPDGMFANVPFALDPNPAPGPSPLADSRTYNIEEDKKNQRDYFNGGKPGTQTSHRDLLKERSGSSRSSSQERRSKSTSSPHIAFQEKGRGPSGDRVDSIRRKDMNGGLTISKPVESPTSRSVMDGPPPRSGSRPVFGSNNTASPDAKDDPAHLRAQLRQAQQRISELESEVNKLNESASKSSDIKQVNSELKEKRSTIAVLDTQREVVMRELDIMTEHLKAAKDQQRPLDLQTFQSGFFREFASELEKFKAKIRVELEELVQKRNEVNDDILNLIRMKDKGYQEYESLSQKNAQLAELNNQLVQTIQDLYKTSRLNNGSIDGGRPAANGLGIYTNNNGKDKSDVSIADIQKVVQEHQMNNLANDMEEPTIVAAPKVIHIPKTKQNKFNWKKGGQAVAKNVTKGLKGAFASQQQINSHDGLIGGVPYGAMQPGATPHLDMAGAQKGGDRAGFGFFGSGQKAQQKPMQKPMHNHNNSTTLLSAAEGLFGSDLSERCEFEKATIPSIVRRCIQEVELRGVDVEGIYRKSGGSGQVNQVRAGFEKDPEYDISDPDLDIHAVTSALKQYFRRLPNPLITFEVYDELLAAGQIQEPDKLIPGIRSAIDTLPPHHRDCLEFLIFHLARVMEQKKDNLMTAVNLAVVFAPTVMRPQSIEREMTDMGPQRTAIQALLENNKAIFAPEPEVLNQL
ncbi:putative rho gtpase activator protein [Neofusicoccum parvum UCRNP2]|uniref:Putative rho gtpase activator protein n=1 Tax=Botryosphaeria parva (strain UCR-NP2) TaxID=1287680 RepID=R1G647_BOTPV|nr:putative rho gtpase activator protein [Neofusicoccum parvum UCRNP2]